MIKGPYIHFLFFIFICGNVAFAQPGTGFEVISTAQGLSQGLINDMIQDREGFIWIATKGGLNRYDGYSFKIFTNDPQDALSISSNSISTLLEDRMGRLWIGTYDGGVNVYDKKTGHFLRIGQGSGLSSNRIESDMAELPDGRILVSPQGGRINIISLSDAGKPLISSLDIPGNRSAQWVLKDEKSLIWIKCPDHTIYTFNPATSGFGLLFDGHRFTALIEKTGRFVSAKFSQSVNTKVIPDIRSGFIDSTGNLVASFLTGKGGKLLMDHRFPLETGTLGCNIFDFSSIKAGDDMNPVYARNLKTEVRDQNIKCLLLDRSGVLWVGTMGHGIYKYRIRSDRFFPLLPHMSIQRLSTWDKDKVYVQGWRTAKLLNAQGEELRSPVEAAVSNAPAYMKVLKAANGDYWMYWNGAKKMIRYTADMKLAATYPEPVDPTITEQLQPLIEDRRGRIWVCGANGSLAQVNPATGRLSKFVINTAQYTGTTALTQTNAFYEDGQGIFWLGTEHGFARLEFQDDQTMPHIKWFKNIPGDPRSLSYNYVSWFTDDPRNPDYLWVCTKGGGLNRMQKSTGEFIHYTTKNGLPNDVVYGVLADKAGNLWGSTNKGLFCLPAGNKKEIRVFTTSDGLQADEFNTNAFTALPDGHLVFGGVNGLNIFNPQKVLASGFTPGVFITGIQIGNKNVLPGDETGVLTQTIEQTSSITLHYLQDVLTLEFSSLDFTAPLQNKYRYRLIGIDKEWVESGTRRTATYVHLPSGNYIFKVQGSNSQGIWSDQVAELKIKVLPPWWLSWWAYGVYALLAAGLIRAYLRFNVNKARLQSQLNYEQIEAKRVKELDTIKTQLYTNITHEFRTPLTVILGMAQQVMDKPSEQFETRMEMIVRNGRNLLNLVNQLLDLSKLETGKMQLNVSGGDVIGFLRYVVESFQSLAESQQKQLHFLTDLDALYMKYDREKLRQIVTNLLSNAIKFTPEKGNIYIGVLENPDPDDSTTLLIKVKDTGIGIPPEELPYVFDRFYRADNSHTRKTEGTGIGLALTKELVKLMDGTITVKSPPAGAHKGSEFTVALALKRVEPGDLKKGIIPAPQTRVNSPVAEKGAEATGELNEKKKEVIPQVPQAAANPPLPERKDATLPLILLVEDNADVVAYTASCLPDYRLAVGKDGREGLEIATDIIPDLIISDVMMPYMDGFELVHRLRQDESTSHIPVILLTAKTDIASKIEGIQQGADAYLEKPFHKEELQARIRKLLEMRQNLQQYYLKKAGLSSDPAVPAGTVPDPTLDPENSFVKRVREAIEQNFTDVNFTVEKLCKLVFMSHSQLHRKLDALTGCSPNRFIRLIRLNKAKTLLLNPENSIAAAALECGYQDPGYFARVFKQEFGVTPQEWRTGR